MSAPSRSERAGRGRRPIVTAHVVAGSLYVAAIVAVAAVAAWPIYRSPWLAVLVASSVVAATAIAALARWRRWGWPLTAAAVAVAFVVIGVPLAVPSRAAAADIPQGLADLAMGVLVAWKDLVTIDLPVGTYRNLLVPALVVFLIGTCVTLILSWRDDRWAYFAAPLGIAMTLFGLVFGASATSAPIAIGPVFLTAPVETAVGVAAFVTTLGWLAWRSREERVRALQRAAASSGVRMSRKTTSADRRRAALGAGILSIAVVAAVAVVPYAARGADRDVLRVFFGPEIDLAAEVSPLSAYRSLFADETADDVLFTVRLESGGASRVRLATLDRYDGEVFRAGGSSSSERARFVRVPSALDAGAGESVRADVVIEGLEGIWMPTVGRVSTVDFAGARASSLADSFYYSASAEAGVQLAGGGLSGGDAYVVSGVEPDVPALAAIAAPGGLDSEVAAPESLRTWVERHGTGTDGAALEGLVALLRERGYLSHGLSEGETSPVWMQSLPGYEFQPSASGHSLARISQMFDRLLERETDPRAAASGNYVASIGDDEQFAVAIALIARELGFPSRVVVGARLSSPDATLATCADGVCRAQDIAAWTEVQAATGEWVPIDATPQRQDSPSLEVTQKRDPENVTSVRPDTVEEVVPPDPTQEDAARDSGAEPPEGVDLAWLWPIARVTGVVLLVLLVAFGPLLAVVAAKAARRRGRRTHPQPAARIAGGWDEYVDAAVDAGRQAPQALTRSELAEAFATSSGARLAHGADHAVFSRDASSSDEAAEFWRIVEEERRLLRSERGFWRGLLTTVSLSSFFRHLRPATGRRERTAERGARRSERVARTSP